MTVYINRITPEMVTTVDKLKQSNFEGATPEEIELYAQYKAIQTLHDEEMAQKREAREARNNERMQIEREKADASINALNALAELAQARLKAVENGE